MSRRPTIVAPTILPAFLAGSVAGATGCVVGHPFDLLKVVQQTSEKNKLEKAILLTLPVV
jgi:hypothetical protein